MVLSAPPSQGHWKQQRGRRTRRESQIFTDTQAATRRMASEDPGPAQICAIQARKHIAAPRKAGPDICH